MSQMNNSTIKRRKKDNIMSMLRMMKKLNKTQENVNMVKLEE